MKAAVVVLVLAALGLPACGGGSGGSSSGGSRPPAFVSAPDCAGPQNIVAEESAAPVNATYLRVQHIGDPGTAELAGEISQWVTWSVGDYTGLYPPDPSTTGTQRGYRDLGPPIAASAFQLSCGAAGFLINSWQFSHSAPLVGEGPSASVARDFDPWPSPFPDAGAALAIEATINVKHAAYQSPHVDDGTAQVSFFYYALDSTTGTVIAHLVQLFDSRPPSTGAGRETVGFDGHVVFVVSPLAASDPAGQPVQYVTVDAGSDGIRFERAWGNPLAFKARVPYDRFRSLLLRLRSGSLPAISARPEDYRLLSFGVLGEVFPGTGTQHNVSLGASVADLRLTAG